MISLINYDSRVRENSEVVSFQHLLSSPASAGDTGSKKEALATGVAGVGRIARGTVGYCNHSHGKSPFVIGKPSINGHKWAIYTMAMLNNQRVHLIDI